MRSGALAVSRSHSSTSRSETAPRSDSTRRVRSGERSAASDRKLPASTRETGTAHFYLANVLRFFNDTDGADRHFAAALDRLGRALALDPSDLRLLDRTADRRTVLARFVADLGAEDERLLAGLLDEADGRPGSANRTGSGSA